MKDPLNHNKQLTTEDKINKIWKRASLYSSLASQVARQLAFGEGAIFWFFFNNKGNLTIPLIVGLSFLVLYFIFDIFQYLIGAWVNKDLARVYEELNKDDSLRPNKITRPDSMNIPMYCCYYIKFAMLAIASLLLLGLFISLFVCKTFSLVN